MHHIAESIEISSPPGRVFAFIKNPEERMRLNPSCTLIGSEQRKTPDGKPCFRFFLQADGKRFKCDVEETVERDRILSRAVDGSLCVTLTIIPTPRGTRLLHEENFVLPDEVLEPKAENPDSRSFKLFRQVLRMFFGLDYYEARKARKAEEIVAVMRQSLKAWLVRIKEAVELTPDTVQEQANAND